MSTSDDELLVRDVAVVALQEVVDDVLPVRAHVVAQPLGVGQLGDVGRPARDLRGQVGGLLRQRRGGGVEVDVDEAAELLDLHLVEADLALVEGRHPVGPAGGLQRAVEVVGPRVVRADDVARRPRPGQQLVRAVLADVVERAQSPVPAADHRDRHPGDRRRHVAARLPQLLDVADPLPGPGEDRRQVDGGPLRIGVRLGPQGHRTRRVRVVAGAMRSTSSAVNALIGDSELDVVQ